MKPNRFGLVMMASLFIPPLTASHAQTKEKPLIRDFMGVNGHTKFDPRENGDHSSERPSLSKQMRIRIVSI
jgi:hypothetical protein